MAQASSKVPTTAFTPRRLKQVTFPTFKIRAEEPRYFKFSGAIHQGNAMAKAGADGTPMKPANIALVVDLTTGEQGQIVIPAVLERVLMDSYEGDSYIGKGFEIVKHAPADGKRYSTFDVNEIAVD